MGISSVLGSSALLPAGLGFRNLLINGAMQVDQKNTATTAITTNTIATDRWFVEDGCDAVLSAQQSTDVPTGQGFNKSLKVTATTADTSIGAAEFSVITQHIEGTNSAQLAWGTSGAKPIVVSFWVKATVTGTYSFTVYNNGASRICPSSYTINASNTWEKKIIYINGDSSGTWLTDTGRGVACNFYTVLGSNYLGSSGVWNSSSIYGVTGQANPWATVGNVFAITGVQLEQNYQPTPFEQRPYGTELSLCQRYYWRIYGTATGYARVPSCGTAYNNSAWQGWVSFPTPMRVTPTSIDWSGIGVTDSVSYDSTAFVTLGINPSAGTVGTMFLSGTGASSVSNTSGAHLILRGNATAFIGASAEL